MNVEVCFSPALYPYYADEHEADTVVVVVDIFRATTTICKALLNGAAAILPVASVEEAKEYKSKGYLVGAERKVQRCEFADFGNSPATYVPEKVAGREIVFTTTNGTQAINIAANCGRLIIGSFSNISAVADYCNRLQKRVLVLCSGWHNHFNMEDTLFAGALACQLREKGFEVVSDAANVACDMWMQAKADPKAYLSRSEHVKRLAGNGLEGDIDYCLTADTLTLVPVFDKETRKVM